MAAWKPWRNDALQEYTNLNKNIFPSLGVAESMYNRRDIEENESWEETQASCVTWVGQKCLGFPHITGKMTQNFWEVDICLKSFAGSGEIWDSPKFRFSANWNAVS